MIYKNHMEEEESRKMGIPRRMKKWYGKIWRM